MAFGMDPEPNRKEATFQAALKLATPERGAFLSGACFAVPA
jgi:hypothetical protein